VVLASGDIQTIHDLNLEPETQQEKPCCQRIKNGKTFGNYTSPTIVPTQGEGTRGL
jgi:hypothetical protein